MWCVAVDSCRLYGPRGRHAAGGHVAGTQHTRQTSCTSSLSIFGRVVAGHVSTWRLVIGERRQLQHYKTASRRYSITNTCTSALNVTAHWPTGAADLISNTDWIFVSIFLHEILARFAASGRRVLAVLSDKLAQPDAQLAWLCSLSDALKVKTYLFYL